MSQEWSDTCNGTEHTAAALTLSNESSNNYMTWDNNCWLLEAIEQSKRFVLPWWRVLLWSVLFGITVLISAIGNLIVIWIVVSDKKMRTVTNYFLVNLSVADTMVTLFNVTFTFIYMVTNHWPFGYVYCKLSQFIAVVSVSGSVFTLVAISVERYLGIVYPLRPRMSKRTTAGLITILWVASALISIPHLIYAKTEVLMGSGRTACYLHWPDGISFQSHQEYIYNIMYSVLTYFLPICVMSFTYFQVARVLWSSRGIGECTELQLEYIRSKRKIVKMLVVVVAIFVTCWLPYHVYFIVSWLYPEINNWDNIQEIYLVLYWLAMSNACYYPIIWCWMNLKFRNGFLRVIHFCFRYKTDNQQEIMKYGHGLGYSSGYPGSLLRVDYLTKGAGTTTVGTSFINHFNRNETLRGVRPSNYSRKTI